MKKLFSFIAVLSLVFSPITPAFALARISIADNEIWGGTAAQDPLTTDVTEAVAGDDVDLDGWIMDVTNDQTADDGTGGGSFDDFTIGDITDGSVGQTGAVQIYTDSTGTGGDLTVTINSVNIGADFDVWNNDGDGIDATVIVTNDLIIGGTLYLTNSEATNDNDVSLSVGGMLNMNNATIAGGDLAGADTTLTLSGDSNLGAGITLIDQAGQSYLIFDGNGLPQNVSGIIVSNDDASGTVSVLSGGGNIAFVDNVGNDDGAGDGNLAAIDIDGAGTAAFGGNVGTAVMNFNADGTVEITGAADIGSVVVANDGDGTLTLLGGGTVTGDIGSGTDALGTLLIDNSTLQIADGADLYIDAIDSNGSADGILTFLGTSTVQGVIGANDDLLELNINGAGTVTLNGVSAITTTTFNAAGALDINADLTGDIDFNGNDGTVTLAGGSDITGGIDNTAAGGVGTLIVTAGGGGGAGDSNISGSLGGSVSLLAVDVQAAAGDTVSFSSGVDVTTFTMSGAGKAQFDGGAAVTSLNITGTGEVELNAAPGYTIGTTTFTGAGTLDLNADPGGDIDFQAAGTVDLEAGSDLTGNISTDDNNQGALIFSGDGDSTVSGTVGASAVLDLATITKSGTGTGTFSSAVFANAMNITGTGEIELDAASTIATTTFTGAGTLDLDATLTGNIVMTGAAGTIDLAGGSDIDGSITTDGDDQGILNIEAGADSQVTGTIGTSATLDLATINVASAGGETATFAGAVYANALNITDAGTTVLGGASTIATTTFTGAGTLDLNNTLTGDVDFAGLGGTVLVADGFNVVGDVDDSVGAGNGTLTFEGASTISNAIGGTNDLLAVNIGDGTAAGGIVTMGNDITATTTTVDSGATLQLNAARAITGDLTLADGMGAGSGGTLDLGLNTLTLSGNYTGVAGTTLNVGWDGAAFGILNAGGTADLTGTLNVTVGGTYIAGGATADVVVSGAALLGLPTTITDNSYVLSFTGAESVAGTYTLTAARTNSYTSAVTGGNAGAAAQALETAGTQSHTSDMTTVLNTLDSLGSAKEIQDAIDTMIPDVSSGVMQASRVITAGSFSMISNRLGGARNGGAAGSGVSSGEMSDGLGIWVQGLGSHMKQDERKGIQGFTANTWGATIGADKVIDRHFRLGLAGSYGWARVNSKQPGNPSSDINSFQGTLYGSYDSLNLCEARQSGRKSPEAVRSQTENHWYVDGMFAFTQNNYDSRREIWLTPTNKRVAKAEHYAQQYSTQFEAGYTFVFEETKALEITPFASLGYSYLYMNSYKEKGANALNLKVDGEGFNQLEQGLGTKLAYPMVAKKVGTFIPSVKAAWLLDYIGDRFETTASFEGGGPSFNTTGAKPAKNGVLIGAELAFLNKGNLTVTGNWDMELKDQFMSNAYYGTVRYDF